MDKTATQARKGVTARRHYINERRGLRYEWGAPYDLAGGQHDRPKLIRLDNVDDPIALDAISSGQERSKIGHVRHAAQPTQVTISQGAALEVRPS